MMCSVAEHTDMASGCPGNYSTNQYGVTMATGLTNGVDGIEEGVGTFQ